MILLYTLISITLKGDNIDIYLVHKMCSGIKTIRHATKQILENQIIQSFGGSKPTGLSMVGQSAKTTLTHLD